MPDTPVSSINPPLPPLVEFPKPEKLDLTIVSAGFGSGLALGVLGKLLEHSGHDQLFTFLNSLNSLSPVGLLLIIAGLESTLAFQVLAQVLVSWAIGWKILAVSLGPLKLSCTKEQWRLALARTFWHHSVTSIPTDSRPPGLRLSSIVAAGPISLLAIAALSLLGYAHFAGSALLRNYFAAASLGGFAVSLFSLFPNAKSASLWNPARFFLAALTADPELQNRATTLRLLGFAHQKRRPRDAPLELISAAARPAPGISAAVMRANMIGNWCLDQNDLVSAGAWYDRLADLAQYCSPATKNAALASSACFDLAWRENSQEALRKLKEVNPALLTPNVSRLCTQALVHILNGDGSKAESAILQAESACSGPFGDYQCKTLTRLRTMAESLKPAYPAPPKNPSP